MESITIGIDVSKETLDICLHHNKNYEYFVINNTVKSIAKFFKQYKDYNVLLAMENTGRYNWNLFEVLANFNFSVYVLNPLHLSKSLGLTRGKDDKTDAYRICCFIERNHQDLSQWTASSKAIKKLKILLTERVDRVKQRKRLLNQQKHYKLMKDVGLDKELNKQNKQSLNAIDKQIARIEGLIVEVINSNKELKEQSVIMQSVPGVGKVVSWYMLVKTEGFTKITNPRKMACYSGVVPFEHQSGTSIYKRPRVSNYADKSMKTMLHFASMSAIRRENDLAHYYHRKVKEGKNKMSVLNAVRNKIIHIIFALVKKKEFFKNNLVVS